MHSIRSRIEIIGRGALGVLLLIISFCSFARAQNCESGMLLIDAGGGYIAVPYAPSLAIQTGFTIECWAKADTPVQHIYGLIEQANPKQSIYDYSITLQPTRRVVGAIYPKSNNSLSAPADSFQTWHHYALVYLPSDSLYLYRDGIEVKSIPGEPNLSIGPDSVRIGMSSLTGGGCLLGAIDEVRIWNYARTAGDIQSVMMTRLQGPQTGLVAYYAFDDEPGATRIHDFSGQGNDGFVRGAGASVVPSTSPVGGPELPGYRLNSIEKGVVFGTIRCQSSWDTVIHVRNLGASTLHVRTLGFSRGLAYSISTVPFDLAPDSTMLYTVGVHFAPPSGGVFSDTLIIEDTDICGGTVRIGFSGSYDNVGLTVTPDTLQFGAVTPCQFPARLSATVQNTSTTDDVVILNGLIPSGFTMLTPLPLTIKKGQSTKIDIQVDTGVAGQFATTITLTLDKCSRIANINVAGLRNSLAFGIPSLVKLSGGTPTLSGLDRDGIVVITNVGTDSLLTTPQLAPDSIFSLRDSRRNVALRPGDTMQLVIHAHALRCGHYRGLLHLFGSPCNVDTSIILAIDVDPPQSLTANAIDIGVVCATLDTVVKLYNPNDDSMIVQNAQFSPVGMFTIDPNALPRGIGAKDTLTLKIHFTASHTGDFTVNAIFATLPCGNAIVQLHAGAGVSNVNFADSVLYFGRGCDVSTKVQTINLTNNSARALTITNSTLAGSSRFSTPDLTLPITLGPGRSFPVPIQYYPPSQPPEFDDATLTLFSDNGCVVDAVHLTGSREVGKPQWVKSPFDMGLVCPGTVGTDTILLRNGGLDTMDITSAMLTGQGNAFSMVSSPRTIASGDTGEFIISYSSAGTGASSNTLLIGIGICGKKDSVPIVVTGGPDPKLALSTSTIDFGGVHVGDTATLCLDISNASCIPLTIGANNLAVLDSTFFLSESTRASLPDSAFHGKSIHVCFHYAPKGYAGDTDVIALPGVSPSFSIKGIGVVADLRTDQNSIDFGYVVHDQIASKVLRLSNLGDTETTISFSVDNGDFFVPAYNKTLEPRGNDTLRIDFKPTIATGLAEGTLTLYWSGGPPRIVKLRGQETDSGLILSSVGLDFGNVHLDSSKTLILDFTGTTDLPIKVDSIVVGSSPSDEFSAAGTFPFVIASPIDSTHIPFTFAPKLEAAVTSVATVYYSTLTSGPKTASIPLTGRGVIEHIALIPDTLDFGPQQVGVLATLPMTVLNTGYDTLTLKSGSIGGGMFSLESSIGSWKVGPQDSRPVMIGFTPTRAIGYTGTASVLSSAKELPSIVLRGQGAFAPLDLPQLEYSLPTITATPGDTISIPITYKGSNLSKLDLDTVRLRFEFDSLMIAPIAFETGASLLANASYSAWNRVGDSEYILSFFPAPTSKGTLGVIRSEMLLGFHDTSTIAIRNISATNGAQITSSDGSIISADCGGATHGVAFRGQYDVKNTQPNPVKGIVTLQYTLGLSGQVTLDLFDELGRPVRRLLDEEESKGDHVFSEPLTGLPNGRYVYRLESGEFVKTDSFILSR